MYCFANVHTVDAYTAPYYTYHWFRNGTLLKFSDPKAEPQDESNLKIEYQEKMTDPQPGLVLKINRIKVRNFNSLIAMV